MRLTILVLVFVMACAGFSLLRAEPPTSKPADSALPKPDNEYETFWVDVIPWMNKVGHVLEGVKSVDDANAVLPELTKLETDAAAFRDRIKKLGEPTEEVRKTCLSKYGTQIQAATSSSIAQRERIMGNPELNAVLKNHLDNLGIFSASVHVSPAK